MTLVTIGLAPVETEGGEHLAAPPHNPTAECSDHRRGTGIVIDVGEQVAPALPEEVLFAHITALTLILAVLVLAARHLLHFFYELLHWRHEILKMLILITPC